ncbi:unnamed protein product [Paramecium octaurelia]|uniref:RNase NYN domain-containing protein n=1 Tax=Paramecium octaurelia TaxID=43137 RepID=A0A8S1UZ35_PAROT|nr:unnamed protein product [Paramecium octaurelia]
MNVETQSSLYNKFKHLLDKLKNKEKPPVVFTLHELNCDDTKQFFQVTAELISSGINFVIAKQIDKRMWHILKQQIDIELKSISPDVEVEIQQFYDLRINFLRSIIKDLTQSHQLGALNNDNEFRQFLANLYCYAGELHEHLGRRLEKMNQKPKDNYKIADLFYNKAISIYPFQGKYYFLIATLMRQFQDTFNAVCNLQKAYFAQIPYNCKENMNEVFEINRTHFNDWAKHVKPASELDRDTYLRTFMVYLIRFNTIVFTKIGFEELTQLTNMFFHLQEYFNIIKTNVHSDYKQQYQLLLKVIMMTNFGLHNSITTFQLKTVQEINDNDLVRESIKYVFGLYVNSLDFILKYLLQNSMKNLDQVPPVTFLQLIIPIIYYLYDQPLICTYLLSAYPSLNDKLAQIFLYSRQNLYQAENMGTDLFQFQTQLNKQFHNFLFPFEVPLVGFTCYNHVLQTFKQQSSIYKDEDSQTSIILFYVCEQIIQQLPGIQISNVKEPKWEQEIPKELIKKLIIIDGMNVAMRYGQEQSQVAKFCSQGLKCALEFWVKRGHDVMIILPDFCFSESEISKKKLTNQNNVNKLPDDVKLLLEMKNKGYAYGVPNWNYDDSYMIQYAREKGGLILTNDRYNDHIRALESNIVERERLKEWIRNNCISYTFLQNELVPNPDQLKRI